MGRTVCRSRAAPRFASIVSGVTASLALIDAAIAARADAILVHHGLFWRGQDGRVTGWLQRACWRGCWRTTSTCSPTTCRWTRTPSSATTRSSARGWGWRPTARFGEQDLGFIGRAGAAADASRRWPRSVQTRAGPRAAGACRATAGRCERVAWCTGGAQGYFEAAIAAGADAFITGEISEPQAHLARETGVAFSPAATTPPSATARRRWPRRWPRSSASSTSSSTSTTRHEHRASSRLAGADAWATPAASAPRSSRRLFARRRLRRRLRGASATSAVMRRAAAADGGVLPVARHRRAGRRCGACRRAACRCWQRRACRPTWPQLPLGRVDARAGAAAARVHRAGRARWRCAGEAAAHRHRADPQGGAGRRRRALSRPHRDAAGAGRARRAPPPVRMMLANDELRMVLVTHPRVAAPRDRRGDLRRRAARRCASPTRAAARLGPAAPRIAVAGLNPHAGEGGLFGDEEIRFIAPGGRGGARRGHRRQRPVRARHGVHARPPRAGHPGEFDLVVAMTHDHGLIPVKYLGVEQGVNVTLGLPFVRTSPDHGTAFDIAGSGRADPASLIAARAHGARGWRAASVRASVRVGAPARPAACARARWRAPSGRRSRRRAGGRSRTCARACARSSRSSPGACSPCVKTKKLRPGLTCASRTFCHSSFRCIW